MLPLVCFAALFALLPVCGQADTVEFIRGGSVNGAIIVQGGKLTIRAEFAQGGVLESVVERRFVSSIEFNDKIGRAHV